MPKNQNDFFSSSVFSFRGLIFIFNFCKIRKKEKKWVCASFGNEGSVQKKRSKCIKNKNMLDFCFEKALRWLRI